LADGEHPLPIILVTGPTPGATLMPGDVTIQGAAFDCHADVGSGINRVAVFLGRREAGGLHLGDATLRRPSPIRVEPADQYSTIGWTLTAAAPLKPGQVNELYVYARSELTNVEAVIAVPLTGGVQGADAVTAPLVPANPTPPPPIPAEAAGMADDRGTAPGNNIPTDIPETPPEPDEPPELLVSG
jgi:hypothetical protein